MLKTHPLFGVGIGRYTEFNELVSHNSFTHTIGELGLFGAFFFVGMRPHAVESHAWGEDLWQSGVALAVCAMFLSRQYNMLPFVWLALSSVYARQMALRPAVQPARAASHAARIAALTVAGAVCTYAVVRLFGDWSA